MHAIMQNAGRIKKYINNCAGQPLSTLLHPAFPRLLTTDLYIYNILYFYIFTFLANSTNKVVLVKTKKNSVGLGISIDPN